MNEREQFIQKFVQTGKSKGASQQEVSSKLKQALTEYDGKQPKNDSFIGSLAKDVGGFANVAGQDVGEMLNGVGDMITHPVDTGKNLLKLANGASTFLPGANVIPGIVGAVSPQYKQYTDEGRNMAGAIGDDYAQKYGVKDALKGDFGQAAAQFVNTVATKPVSSTLDASMLLGGVGAVTKASSIPKLAKVGSFATKASELMDPINVASKAMGKTGTFLKGKLPKGVPATSEEGTKAMRLAEFKQSGFTDVPASFITTNPAVKMIEGQASRSIGGENIVRKAEDIRTGVANQMNDLVNKQIGLPNEGTVKNLKNTFNKDLSGVKESIRKPLQETFQSRDAFLKKNKASVNSSVKVAKSILDDFKYTNNPTLSKVRNVEEAFTEGNLYNVKTLLDEISNDIPKMEGTLKARVTELVKLANKDIIKSIKPVDSGLASSIKSANKTYNSKLSSLENITPGFDTAKSDSFMKDLGSKSEGEIKAALKSMEPKVIKSLGETYSKNLLNNSIDTISDKVTGVTRRVINSKNLAKQLSEIGDTKLKAILGGSEYANLKFIQSEADRLNKLAKYMESAGFKGGSNFVIQVLLSGGIGTFFRDPMLIASLIGGQYAMAKMIDSPIFRKLASSFEASQITNKIPKFVKEGAKNTGTFLKKNTNLRNAYLLNKTGGQNDTR